jgi:Xaa-Pro aminopeptidase
VNIAKIQAALKEQRLDGWLLADFHGRNDIAVKMIGLNGIVTRRSFYFIPAKGEPTAMVSPIEIAKFRHLEGNVTTFKGYKMLERMLAKLLKDQKRIAMEYSPLGRLPYIGLVDAGTIELVRSFDVDIVSSADLVASFQARLSAEQVDLHRTAANNVIEIVGLAHEFIATSLKNDRTVTEFDVVQFIMHEFERAGMETEFPPNCSVDPNAGDPHYEPKQATARTIGRGQLILIDLWGKQSVPDGIYADITWMAYSGTRDEIPAKYVEIFSVLAKARDAAVTYLADNFGNAPLSGAAADDVCRQVIVDAGYGEFFSHRTGHSITTHEHGNGPNIDNLETEDKRLLQPGHLFSVEPGIYTDEFGLRTEINVLITESGPEVTTLPLQTEIKPLF